MAKRIESARDDEDGIARYRLNDRRIVVFDTHVLREIGLTEALRRVGIEPASQGQRMPVLQDGQMIGTVPSDFEPELIRSRSAHYETQPGDFRREGNAWIASQRLGQGDFEAIPGFKPA
ncbi:hypothetical protein [Methylobacterium sp. J-092]|uniref:hypothetical protein n=1 Tax=Methylobacterium sp. J-092 TaxID=2836667 RepID=UPI001FB89BD8|nr:hypothetical protein [Methylobacterium sp. J-092]MCJ2009222.1 hypothetical protein [Methylobacterium sp. J-092]